MAAINRIPIYKISTVMKETGLHGDVIRAWERRYKLPQPSRSQGGQRLYSEYDLAIIKWLQSRQHQGMNISRAVALWNELTSGGQDPLANYTAMVYDDHPATQENRLDILRDAWLHACLTFDVFAAEDALNRAFGLAPVEMVCVEILQKGIHSIGELWHQGLATVQQEHFATGQAIRRIDTLISATPRPTLEETVLVGCPEGEWHSFPTMILTLLLRRRGLNVVHLGASIPSEQMKQTAAAIRPNLTVLAAQQLTTAAALRSTALHFQRSGLLLAFGGLIFNRLPELRAKIPAIFLGERLDGAVERIEDLLIKPPTISIITEEWEAENRPRASFYEKRIPIEMRLLNELEKEGLAGNDWIAVNAYFTEELLAALELGDPALLEADFEWAGQLLSGRRISTDQLKTYLKAYRRAVEYELGVAGSVITTWLDDFLVRNTMDEHRIG